MSTHTMDVTPQEGRLLRAFRLMDREDKLMTVNLAEISVDRERASKPRLTIVVSEKRRSTDTEASA